MKQRSFFKSLRGKITWQMLLISLLPIMIIGIVAYTSVGQLIQSAKDDVEDIRSQLVENVVGEQATDAAETIASGIDQFMLTRMTEMMIWVSSPIIVNTAKMGYIQAEELGLPAASIEEVEATVPTQRRMPGTKYAITSWKPSGMIFELVRITSGIHPPVRHHPRWSVDARVCPWASTVPPV